jgi:hypothetical protein
VHIERTPKLSEANGVTLILLNGLPAAKYQTLRIW